MSIKIYFTVVLNEELPYDPRDNYSGKFNLFYIRKGEKLRKNSKTLSKYNLISFNNVATFEKEIKEDIVQKNLEAIFEYLKKNEILGERTIRISLLPDLDQFGIDISNSFLNFLVKNNCSLTLSGIFL